ncbi:MAG: hypothetical protein ABIP74_03060 [Candidatus Saccharimonas sp.]
MKNLRYSRIMRALYMVVAGSMVAAAMSISMISPASAAPVAPSTAPFVAQTAAPSSLALTPVTSHCGSRARWVTSLKGQDSRLKFRIWHYVDRNNEWQYCSKVYKVKPKHNKTLIKLKAFGYYGWTPTVKTRGSSAWVRHASPEGWYSFVRVTYGKITYSDIILLSR